MGEYAEAIAAAQEAKAISQQLNNLWGQSYSQYKVGCAHWEQGDPDCARQAMHLAIDLAERAGFASPQLETRADLALLYGELGANQRGFELISAALAAADVNPQQPVLRVYILSVLARLHLQQNRLDAAAEAVAEANRHPSQAGVPAYFVGSALALADAELAFQQNEYRHALALSQQWVANLRQYGIRFRRPYALHMQGKIHLALGNRVAAHTCWQAARTEATTLGSRWSLWQILAALAQLEENADQAAQLRREAQTIVTFIADHICDADLRASFLNLPAVYAVFDD